MSGLMGDHGEEIQEVSLCEQVCAPAVFLDESQKFQTLVSVEAHFPAYGHIVSKSPQTDRKQYFCSQHSAKQDPSLLQKPLVGSFPAPGTKMEGKNFCKYSCSFLLLSFSFSF